MKDFSMRHIFDIVLLQQNINIFKYYFIRGACVTEDSDDTRPETGTLVGVDGVSDGSSSVLFQPVQDGCLVSPPSQKLGALGSLTLALWIKPSSPEEM